MSENLPEKSGENKDLYFKKGGQESLSISLSPILQGDDLLKILNNQKSGYCPIQLYYSKNDAGENVVNSMVITTEPQSRENFAQAIMDITGIVDIGLAHKLCCMAAHAIPGGVNEGMIVILQALNNYKPKNSIEAGLVAQAAILEMQGLRHLQRAESAETLHHRESAINIATKLLRLQHETLESLNRHRRNGEQRVVVQHQHVQVNDGGKAIVGNNIAASGGK